MKLACIIPTYNMAATVGRAIDSAFAAGCEDVTVVDDCSTDGTAELLRSYGDRITVWTWPRKPTSWLAANRVVFDATPATHFVWLSADDLLEPGLADAIRPHADAGVVFTDYRVVAPDSTPLYIVSQDVDQPVSLAAVEMRHRMQTREIATETGIGSVLRREVAMWLWETGFEQMGPHADSIGYATAACMHGCVLLPIVGASYTFTESSYGRKANKSEQEWLREGTICRQWMEWVGLDIDTTKALARKRCQVTW